MGGSSTTRFGLLLGVLSLLLILLPLLAETGHGLIVVGLGFPVLLLASAYAVGGRETALGRAVLFLAGLAVVGDVLLHVVAPAPMIVLSRSLQAAFLLLVAGLLLVRIFREREVTADTILGGICVYLLLGIVFHAVFALLEYLVPGSFVAGGRAIPDVGLGRHPELLYYSFVTLTTLGYGDITPTWSLPRSLSAVEAVIGQLYLTILVAILVGMHLAARSSR